MLIRRHRENVKCRHACIFCMNQLITCMRKLSFVKALRNFKNNGVTSDCSNANAFSLVFAPKFMQHCNSDWRSAKSSAQCGLSHTQTRHLIHSTSESDLRILAPCSPHKKLEYRTIVLSVQDVLENTISTVRAEIIHN